MLSNFSNFSASLKFDLKSNSQLKIREKNKGY